MVDQQIKTNWIKALNNGLTLWGAEDWERKLKTSFEVLQRTGGTPKQLKKAETLLCSLQAAISEYTA